MAWLCLAWWALVSAWLAALSCKAAWQDTVWICTVWLSCWPCHWLSSGFLGSDESISPHFSSALFGSDLLDLVWRFSGKNENGLSQDHRKFKFFLLILSFAFFRPYLPVIWWSNIDQGPLCMMSTTTMVSSWWDVKKGYLVASAQKDHFLQKIYQGLHEHTYRFAWHGSLCFIINIVNLGDTNDWFNSWQNQDCGCWKCLLKNWRNVQCLKQKIEYHEFEKLFLFCDVIDTCNKL